MTESKITFCDIGNPDNTTEQDLTSDCLWYVPVSSELAILNFGFIQLSDDKHICPVCHDKKRKQYLRRNDDIKKGI